MTTSRLLLSAAAAALLATTPALAAQDNGLHFPLNQPLEKKPNPTKPRGPHANWADIHGGTDEQQAALDEIRDVLGQGYNSISRTQVNDCVTGWINGEAPTAFSPTYYLNLIKSSEQLKDEMSMEASVSGTIAGWTAKASAKYESEHTSNSSEEFLLVKVKSVSTRKILLHQPKATTTPADESPAAKLKFFQSCGDQYTSGAEMGGEFVALLTYTVKDESDRSAFEAAFSASGAGFSADADFAKKASAFRSQMGLAMEAKQVGGSGGPSANTVDAIMAYSLQFNGTLNPQNAALIGLLHEKYSKLSVDAGDYEAVIDQADQLRDAQTQRAQYLEIINQQKPVLTTYGIGDVHAADRQRLENEFAQGKAMLASCAKDPSSCRIPSSLTQFVAPAVNPIMVTDLGVFGKLIGWNVDEAGRHVAISGNYCFGGEYCALNGISNDPNAWVAVQIDDNPVIRYQGPVSLPNPVDGKVVRVLVKTMDSNYSDNGGTLTAILY